jgi:hypothetical protein
MNIACLQPARTFIIHNYTKNRKPQKTRWSKTIKWRRTQLVHFWLRDVILTSDSRERNTTDSRVFNFVLAQAINTTYMKGHWKYRGPRNDMVHVENTKKVAAWTKCFQIFTRDSYKFGPRFCKITLCSRQAHGQVFGCIIYTARLWGTQPQFILT